MNDRQYAVEALIELRNNALLLTIGNEHLNDEVFLVKIGNSISRSVDLLKRDISALKKEYPGKFMSEVDTDNILLKIDDIAQRLLKPSRETTEKYVSGQLGREIESHVEAVAKAVDDVRMKVQGSPSEQGGAGSSGNALLKVKGVFLSAGYLLNWGIKILACVVVLLLALFTYFYFTMEKDTKYLKEIASTQSSLKEKKNLLLKTQKDKQDLEDKRKPTNRELTREEKLVALDLEVKIKKLDSTIEQTQAEIETYEQKLKENQADLDALRRKPFIKRLMGK
jgi:DNA repair exonuclease SbcCD ATPase subunit